MIMIRSFALHTALPFLATLLLLTPIVRAEEMPTSLSPIVSPMAAASATVSSPVTGITFADAPRLLPVDTRFSQAIQTIGFDVGLTCQQIEAYGWKIAPNEQTRVNNIFANTAEELARLGYTVQPQDPGSAAADITVFTANRAVGSASQDVLFTWSAGKAGLLLLLCDARGDVTKQGFGPAPGTVAYQGKREADTSGIPDNATAPIGNPTDIIGEWAGTYSCLGQGPAGATLTISRVRPDKSGHAVSGMFSFYPLPDKNRGMVSGSYRVAGRYDPLTHRALLEPGRWIQQPTGFSNAPLIAEFDTANLNAARVSALFQGTTGCTSFEGSLRADSAERAASKAYDEAPAKAATKKTAVKKKVVKKAAPKAVETAAPAVDTTTSASTTDVAPVATTTTVTTTVTTPAAATDVPGSTAASSPAASVTPTITTVTTTAETPAVPAAPTTNTVTPPSMAAPATTSVAPAETPVTVPAAPPKAE